MNIKEAVKRNRSYRRFKQEPVVTHTQLEDLVDLARITPSGANRQPLRYRIVTKKEEMDALFPALGWAGYLTDWDGPEETERPTGYIVICCDLKIASAPGADHGIAAQTMLLAAAEAGYGGCMIGSFKRGIVCDALQIDAEQYKPVLVIAFGSPAEDVVLEPVKDSIKYYRTPDAVHHVPKRSLEDVLI